MSFHSFTALSSTIFHRPHSHPSTPQASAFGMGGWWLGGKHMKPYPTFLEEVEAKVPKDASIIVACQKGLR